MLKKKTPINQEGIECSCTKYKKFLITDLILIYDLRFLESRSCANLICCAMRKKMEKYISFLMENELVGETALLNPYLKLEAIDEHKVL